MKPRLFIDLLTLDVINLFIFGHGILIYYVLAARLHGHLRRDVLDCMVDFTYAGMPT